MRTAFEKCTWLASLALLLGAAAAMADESPSQKPKSVAARVAQKLGLDVRAQYEERLVQAALRKRGLTIDPEPEGKRIGAIYIAANEIILPGDLPLSSKLPWTFLNRFHARTRDEVIGRELLFRIGEPFRRDVFEESGRNLRSLFILSIARLIPVRSATPGEVAVLVVTKDQWSLRLNTNFDLDQTRLDALSFQLSEHNLLGRNKRVSFNFSFDPSRYSIGGAYYDPRVWGSRHYATLLGTVYLNRETSAVEGGGAQVTVGRPLFSLRTRWSWDASFVYLQDIVRFFNGPTQFLSAADPRQAPQSGQLDCSQILCAPLEYARLNVSGVVKATYSFGVLYKVNVGVGWRVYDNKYQLTDTFPAAATAEQRQLFVGAQLPRTEAASGPFMSIDAYVARYVRLRDIHTFALSEDFRIGPQASFALYTASPRLGFNSEFLEMSGSIASAHYFRDNLFSWSASFSMRVQDGLRDTQADRYPGTTLYNEYVGAQVREISPRFGPFRLHLSAILQTRQHDLNNQRFALGNDNGLRGYTPRARLGNNMYRVNAELRTTAVNLWTIHLGGVLFYDGGDAPTLFNQPDTRVTAQQASVFPLGGYYQNVGIGARILLPQFNRDVVRLDLAFPFETTAGSYVPRFSAAFGQAF